MKFAPGDVVYMKPPYIGNGRFGVDAYTNLLHTVLKSMDGSNYKLARGRFRELPPSSEWTVIAHESRLEPTR